MWIHPQFDPIAISLGPVAIRWYALSYIVGFALFICLGRYRIRRHPAGVWTREMLDDFLTWGVLGVIVGGRLGFILFYQPGYYFSHPVEMLKVWQGGMAFHGGFLGVLAAMWLFARKHRLSFWQVADFVAPLVPLGIAVGRLGGNFVNGELWGRLTCADAFWAMGFPQAHEADAAAVAADPARWQALWESLQVLPRHPSQLYQAALEGVALFVVVWLFSRRPRPMGQVAMVFLGGYGLCRFVAEFAREPDAYLGLLALNLSMGQWLSVPMVLLAVLGFVYFGRKQPQI